MIAASELHTLSNNEKTQAIGLLFEPCPTLVEFIQPLLDTPQDSWPSLIEQIRSRLQLLLETPEDARIPAIIAAHPRLGAKKVESALSQKEQASLAAASAAEGKALHDLNNEYEARFPGLRYVVFVAGRPRTEIMKDMRERIDAGDLLAEKRTAFEAMCDIALDRAKSTSAL